MSSMTTRYNTGMILPVYQPLGSSSHKLAQQIGAEHGEKATHTGTLDPMAEGVLIVLTGEDRFQKTAYAKWPKVYRFSILWGLQTDTDDSLGILQKMHVQEFPKDLDQQIKKVLPSFVGKQNQVIHPFSARRWQGKSSFDFAREQVDIPEKTREVIIHSLSMLPSKSVSLGKVQKEFTRRLDLMKDGDWRQDAIQTSWEPVWEKPSELEFPLTWFELHCSHGTYVRQLARDIAKTVQLPGMVWNLVRVQNGEYKK